jgi:Pentapeptide repeats (8 copies)
LERLGSDELYVRIGGVHALEHVMRDSADHHDDVIEVLIAFIRDRVPLRGREPDCQAWMHPVTGSVTDLPRAPTPDIQAALTALAHRPHRPERQRIGLHVLHLTRADLTEANLNGALLDGIDLTSARLRGADLTHAELAGADLTHATLIDANLIGADLSYANLIDANLAGADLTEAFLTGADLSYANLTGANLTYADLPGANLSRADLTGAVWPPGVPVPADWQRGDTGRLARARPWS